MSGSKNETTAVNDAGEIDGKICCLNPECWCSEKAAEKLKRMQKSFSIILRPEEIDLWWET